MKKVLHQAGLTEPEVNEPPEVINHDGKEIGFSLRSWAKKYGEKVLVGGAKTEGR